MVAKYRSIIPRFRSLPALFYAGNILPIVLLFITATILLLGSAEVRGAEIADPLEPVNRVTLRVNRTIDAILLKPVAKTYRQFAPRFVQRGVSNFFNNIGELGTVANDVLQLRLGQALNDLARFGVNSSIGLGGIIEVAEPVFGLQQHDQDFGRTLAQWGVQSGPYLVLPLFGPSTVRDAFGTGADRMLDPLNRIEERSLRDPLLSVRTVHTRAGYLPLEDLIFGDEYLFIRDMYLQHRHYQLNGETMDLAFEVF